MLNGSSRGSLPVHHQAFAYGASPGWSALQRERNEVCQGDITNIWMYLGYNPQVVGKTKGLWEKMWPYKSLQGATAFYIQ